MNLNDLDEWLAERNLGGHWNRHGDQGVVRPFLWKWSDIYRGLMWANELVPIEKTGRRTITLKNPGLKAGMTPTIHMSVQCVLPGEVASAHRHNFDIFVLPAWHWHRHENRADGDSILFSMTDAPTFVALGLYREEAARDG